VLDDVTDSNTRYDHNLEELYFRGRHFNIWLFQTAQYLKTLPPGMRSNCDMVVSMVQHQERQREVIEDDFMADIPADDVEFVLNNLVPPPGTPDEESKLYKGLFVAMNNRENEKIGYDRIFYGKASMTPPGFILGSREWWGTEFNRIEARRLQMKKESEMRGKKRGADEYPIIRKGTVGKKPRWLA